MAIDEDGQSFRVHKIETLPNGTVVGCAGDSDNRDVLALLGKATLTKMPTKIKLAGTKTEFQGLWVFPTGEVFRVEVEHKARDGVSDWTAEILPILNPEAAVGSGSGYALGAMLAGKSAIEAVKIACKIDSNSGLPVESIKIE
jgi:hypothetical protein